MDGGKKLHALTLIASVVDTNINTFFRKLGIAHLRPCLPPVFQRFGTAPVGSGNGVKHKVSICVPDTVAVLVQLVNSVLLTAPFAVLLDGTDGAKHMKMGIGYAAVLSVWLVYSEVNHHATAHKLLQ